MTEGVGPEIAGGRESATRRDGAARLGARADGGWTCSGTGRKIASTRSSHSTKGMGMIMRIMRIMRIGQALGAALLFATLFAVAVLSAGLAVPATAAADAPDGKAIFLAQKCNVCHSVSAAGIERTIKSAKVAGPDLTTATAKHDKAFLEKFLMKQEMLDGKKHGKEWKGTPQELDAVIDWLKEPKK